MASDPVLNHILEAEHGTRAVKACGNLMIGNLEDGSEAIPDPVLAQDIVVDLKGSAVLLTVRFSVSAAKAKKKTVPMFQAKKEFQGLLEQALAEHTATLEDEATPLTAAVEKGSTSTKARRKRKKRKKKKKRSLPGGRSEKGSVEETFEHFVKAARFVRYGDGVKALHPSAKLRLFGLMCQAQHGDRPQSQDGTDEPGASSGAALNAIKQKAWASQKGKTPKRAMEEYVRTLTEIAPQWKIAHLVAGRKSGQGSSDKPRRMMWVIKIEYVHNEKGREPSGKATGTRLKATTLRLLQGANASQAREWFEAKATKRRQSEAIVENSAAADEDDKVTKTASEAEEADPFLKNMPKDLTLTDLIVDVGSGAEKFKTLKEQNKYFATRMQEMAREGHDKEDGWAFLARVEPEGVDVFERKVEWSPVPQMRSRWTALCAVDEVAKFLLSDKSRAQKQFSSKKEQARSVRKMAEEMNRTVILLVNHRGENGLLSRLVYREVKLPWPLAQRDFLYTRVWLWGDEYAAGTPGTFIGCVL